VELLRRRRQLRRNLKRKRKKISQDGIKEKITPNLHSPKKSPQ